MEAQLFLAHADDHQPILDQGMAVDSTFEAPASSIDPNTAKLAANLAAPPDALPDQKWAILAPKGPAGDRLLELIAPLQRKREEEQGSAALVYRVDPKMDSLAAANWMQNEYRDLVNRQEASRPRYLTLLGNPDLVSWELQQMLGGEAFVGRIAFDNEQNYEAYVDKVLRSQKEPENSRATAFFHSVLDGTAATREGHRHLVTPLLEMARATFDVEQIVDVPMGSEGPAKDPSIAAENFLQQAAQTRAALLFTMSHGAGIPKDGWKSLAHQRAQQGALVLGRKGDLLTAKDVGKGVFLPDGVWFMFACYGAGTPARSAYMPWLEKLRALGILGRIPNNVLAALPKDGEPPFVAALPQAALANPDGPLGIVGHVDLAWSWSFLDYDYVRPSLVPRSRAERFQSILQAFVHGHRFGVAHQTLVDFFRSLSTEVATAYAMRADKALGAPDFLEEMPSRVRRANLWMQRQDMGAYVLLGDPATRLPITRRPPGLCVSHSAMTNSRSDETFEQRQEIVMAVLRGTASVGTMAKRHGWSRTDIESWVRVFVDAGRAALAKSRNNK